MKFSANIIWLLIYLFVGIFCLRGVVGAAPYKIVQSLQKISACYSDKLKTPRAPIRSGFTVL